MSRTYWMLFRGYSRASSFEFSSRGTRWYMGLGWSRSSKSSDGRALNVGVSSTLLMIEVWGLKRSMEKKYYIFHILLLPLSIPPLLLPSVAGNNDNGEEDCSCQGGEDDNDDRHWEGWWWCCGRGRETRSLMNARRLRLHNLNTQNRKVTKRGLERLDCAV